MFPSASEALTLTTLTDLVRWYNVDPAVWNAFVGQVGDPTDDYRLLAVLPPPVVEAALENATKASGEHLTVMQATQVGQVYKLARRKSWVASGKPWEDWVETQLWSSSSTGSPSSPSTLATAPTTTSPGERKIKMNGVLDQGDDSEFTLDDTKVTMMAYERYVNLMGGPPTPEQEPTAEQLSAMRRRVETLQLSPYADFAVWVPFAKKNLKALKLKTWTMQQDGSFVAKDLPGPPDHTQQLQGLQDGFADAGGDVPQRAPGLRGVHREGDEALRGGMALDCFRRRQGEVGAAWEATPAATTTPPRRRQRTRAL